MAVLNISDRCSITHSIREQRGSVREEAGRGAGPSYTGRAVSSLDPNPLKTARPLQAAARNALPGIPCPPSALSASCCPRPFQGAAVHRLVHHALPVPASSSPFLLRL